MLIKFLIYFLPLAININPISTGATLKVKVVNIKETKGTIRLCLINNDKRKYLKECDYSNTQIVESKTVEFAFENLQDDEYCISIYHDVNDDQILNTNGLFGMPSEPYGFSNNPSSLFGPPKFKKCLFNLSESQEIEIKLK